MWLDVNGVENMGYLKLYNIETPPFNKADLHHPINKHKVFFPRTQKIY